MKHFVDVLPLNHYSYIHYNLSAYHRRMRPGLPLILSIQDFWAKRKVLIT